jgi:hypothetical protein
MTFILADHCSEEVSGIGFSTVAVTVSWLSTVRCKPQSLGFCAGAGAASFFLLNMKMIPDF